MNIFARLFRRKPKIVLNPNPGYRTRRLAQFSAERRAKYWRNVALAYREMEGG